MSLTSSMWASVSGLLQHGEKMNVIGNNLANVNTVGFKGQRMDFADFVYQDAFSLSGTTQIGKGVQIGAVMGDFGLCSFESSTEVTDMAISGNGFFKVSPIGAETEYYTRAGNFRFSESGELLDPNGYCVQGWKVNENDGNIQHIGAVTDVKFEKWSADPKQTQQVDWVLNLSKDAEDCSKPNFDTTTNPNVANPFSTLVSNWDATQEPHVPEGAYAYQTSMDVYDEAGGSHTLTVYFDKIDRATIDDTTISKQDTMWEYIVTMDPAEDMRRANIGGNVNLKDTNAAGMLMAGTMTFDEAGKIKNQSAFVFGGEDTANYADDDYEDPYAVAGTKAKIPMLQGTDATHVDIADSMRPASISEDGYPMLYANFSGVTRSQTLADMPESKMIKVNFGLQGESWNPVLTPTTKLSDFTVTRAPSASGTPQYTYTATNKLDTMGFSGKVNDGIIRAENSFSDYGAQNMTQSANQDGYTYGNLSNYTVDKEGVLYGVYSNGQTIPVFQLALYDFHCKQGLRREGNNLFSATRESGNPMEGTAGTGTLGSVNSNNLEGSNVNISTEFVRMITTQRGFQANSKNVTTTDTMLETVINMKR